MDPISGLLDGPRARRAFLLRCSLAPPWSLDVRDRAPLTVVAVLAGSACFVPSAGAPVRLAPGDVALIRGPEPYRFADDPGTAPQVVIHPGQRCTTPDGEELKQMQSFGVRHWGNAAAGATELLTGTYEGEGEVSRRLLDVLPECVVLRHDEWESPLLGLLAAETVRDDVGQDAVLDRLLDLVVVDAVRTFLSRAEHSAPGWYRAQHDPTVGQVLRLMHERPGEPWSLASLARPVGVSRATLARRFAELVGQPPMEYLTDVRMRLAADLLLEPRETVASVARAVGYSSPYAFSTAFKRVRRSSPQAHRRAERPALVPT